VFSRVQLFKVKRKSIIEMTNNSALQHKISKLIEERASQSPSDQIIEAGKIIDEIDAMYNLKAF